MIYLMRHGADPSERYGGWSTYGLTEKGRDQVHSAWYEFKKQVGKSNVLLVSHGGVMNIILCLENGIRYTNKETHFQTKDAEILQIDI